MRSLAVAMIIVAGACGQDPGGAGDAGVEDAAPAGQGGPPRGDLAINEIAADGPDWIEITNRGTTEVDLAGWFVSDSPDRLDHYYRFPDGTTLAPGGYLIVYCGSYPAASQHNAPFKLARSDGATLIRPDGVVADSLLFLAGGGGTALARVPDGEGLFFAVTPTPEAANPEALP